MSAGAVAGGVVGGVIGFFVGGPAGAAIGFGIGMSVGGMLDPVKGPSQPGPQINDKNFQTAKYGEMLSRFYGTVPVFGNVTWIEGGKLKVTIRKKKSGGKGGSAKAAPVAYYSATFFLSLGLGPIAGIRRIWCSDKLIYNAGSDDLETIIASNQAATGFKVYLGTDDQLPDPRYEADVGVGNASAYRGEAYIAFYDFQLADFGNTLQGAQFKVEVVKVTDLVDESRDLIPLDAADGSYFNFYSSGLGVSMDSGWSVSAGATYTVDHVGVDLTLIRQEARINAGDSLGDTRLWMVGESSDGWGISRDNNFGYCKLMFKGAIAAYLKPTVGDQDSWWYLTTPTAVPWYARVWLTEDAVYIGVQSTGSPVVDFNRIYRWPLAGAVTEPGEYGVVAAAAQSPVITPTGSGIFWMSISAGYVWSLDGSAQLQQMDMDLNVVDTLATPFSVANIRGFTLDNTHFYLVTATAVQKYSYPGFVLEGSVSGTFSAIESRAFVLDGVLYVHNGSTIRSYTFNRVVPELEDLADIIEAEVALSSLLTAADIDTSLLTAQVRGYRVSGGSIRSALEPLQGAFPFDIIQSGYQLKCVPRGQSSAVTIPWEDLGAADGDTPGDLLQESREMDSQLPALVAVKYLDAAREYAVGEQSKARINTQAINRVDREVSLVLTADEAAGMADVLVNLPWLERAPAKFTLPPPYLDLEPADVVTVVTQEATHEFRLTDINYTPDGRLECEAKPNRAALYTSTAKGGEGVPPSGEIPLAGPSLFVPLDIPVVDETIQDSPGFVGAMTGYTGGWPGGVLFRSPDSGQTWQDLQGFQGKATLGYARNALASDPGYVIDRSSVLTVDLVSGELESITEDQMLNGQNIFAYGADGRWELIMAASCVLQADGSYQLSTLVRGWKGTEWATGLHVAGDVLVLLDDPDNLFIDMAVASLGVGFDYRAVTSGATIDTAQNQAFTYRGVNLEPLSVVAVTGSRDGSQNLSIDAVRRSRLSSSWWVTGVVAPVGETSESYQIDIMSGSTVKRTLTGTSFPITYSAADQTTDFGSPQASITVNIYQMSSVVGRGYARNATV